MDPNSKASKLIFILIELLIPIIGYVFWNWDFVFIMLFFALDWLVLVIFQFVKIRQCYKEPLSPSDKQYLGVTVFFILSKFIATICITIGVCYITIPNFNLEQEFIRFITYKDAGIAQGFFLVPLCFLNGYLMYKRDFVQPKLYQTKTAKEIFKKSVVIHITTFIVCSAVATLTYFFKFEEIVLLYISLTSILIGKLYFQVVKSNS